MAKSQVGVSVVSPIYNNAGTFPSALTQLLLLLSKLGLPYEVLLIDDASCDQSRVLLYQIAKENSHVRVLVHDSNKGIAATYKELYRKAKYPCVVLFSFDGEWDIADVIKLIQKEAAFDIIIGKRKKKAYKIDRAIVSYLFNTMTTLFFGVDPIDAGSIKLLHKNVIETVPVYSESVYDEAERIIKASKMGFSVGSITVEHLDSKKKKGVLTRLPLIVSAVKDMIRLFFEIHTTQLPATTAASPASATRGRADQRLHFLGQR
jgi:glycosyltransferase involved in cell wall biosynthesis